MNHKKRVILLEFSDEAESYLNECKSLELDPNDDHIVALDVKARVWLQAQGIETVDSLDYFDSDSHARALRKSDELLEWMRDRIDLDDELGMKDAYKNAILWYSRFMFHHLIWCAEILSAVHMKHPDATMLVPLGHNDGRGSPFLQASERFLGPMAEVYCAENRIDYQSIKTNKPTPDPIISSWLIKPNKWIIKILGGWIQRNALKRMGHVRPLLSLSRAFRMDAVVGLARKGAPELPWVIMADGALNLSFVELIKRVVSAINPKMKWNDEDTYIGEVWLRVLEWSVKEDPIFTQRLIQGIDRLAESVEDCNEIFCHNDIRFGSFLAAKLRSGILGGVRSVHREILAYHEVLSLLNPRLIIAPFGRRAQLAMGDMATRKGIPGLLISHGTFTKTKNDLEKKAWDFHADGLFHGTFSHSALQTPLAEEYTKCIDASSEFLRTGPLSWGSKINRKLSEPLRSNLLPGRSDHRVVLHAGTLKARSYMHYHVYETMDEYIRGIKELIEAIEQLEKTILIIKFRPIYLTLDEFKFLLPKSDKFVISVEEPFLDVLGISDLLVSFSSTTIEEAFQNLVPVIQYGGEGRYQHVEAPELTPSTPVSQRAVYTVKNPEHLANAIERMLDINGPAPLSAELFNQYVYSTEQVTEFSELVKELINTSD